MCGSNENLIAGLDFLWEEERTRREVLKEAGIIDETFQQIPTMDELFPLSGRFCFNFNQYIIATFMLCLCNLV